MLDLLCLFMFWLCEFDFFFHVFMCVTLKIYDGFLVGKCLSLCCGFFFYVSFL